MDLQRFDVALARPGLDLVKALEAGEGDGYDVHRVTVLHGDQLVSEQAGPRYGLGTDMKARPLGYFTLWCWAALRRMGLEVGEFPPFKDRVLSIDKVPADDPGDAGEGAGVVDPTAPDPVMPWP